MHHSLVNDDLFSLLAISSVVVELQCLNELVLVVGIPLVSLHNWHAALVSLDNVHGKIFDVVLVVLCNQITLDSDNLFLLLLLILVSVILS